MNREDNYRTVGNFSAGNYNYNDYLLVMICFNDLNSFEEIKHFIYKQWNWHVKQPDISVRSLRHIFQKVESQISNDRSYRIKKKSFLNLYSMMSEIISISALMFYFYQVLNNFYD